MSDSKLSQTTLWVITAVAVVAAAAPHAFFAPPLVLHMQGQFDAWLGIAVWAPAILAGVGFFFGVEFGDGNDERASDLDPTIRSGGLTLAVIVGLVVMASMTVDRWSNMSTMHPWEELKTALPMFMGLGLLRAIFFQGFVQHRTLASANTSARVGIVLALEAAVVLPFLISTGQQAAGILPLVLIEAFIGALAYELGYSTRTAMFVRALFSGAFIWFQQAYLL